MPSFDIKRISLISELDSLVEFCRSGDLYAGYAGKSLIKVASDKNRDYLSFLQAVEYRLDEYLKQPEGQESFDIRRTLSEISAGDLSVNSGNSSVGRLAERMLIKYDFINGHPEQSEDTKEKLAKAIEILNDIPEDSPLHKTYEFKDLIEAFKDMKGNDLDVFLLHQNNKNDTYGLNATYSDDFDVRSFEAGIFSKIESKLKDIEQLMFGDDGLKNVPRNESTGNVKRLRNSIAKVNQVSSKLKVCNKIDSLIDAVPLNYKAETEAMPKWRMVSDVGMVIQGIKNAAASRHLSVYPKPVQEVSDDLHHFTKVLGEYLDNTDKIDEIVALTIRQLKKEELNTPEEAPAL